VNAFRRFLEASSGENTERAAAFSDAVFAIAMTLLALEIRVPDVPADRLAPALLGQWIDVAAYALSFFVVGAYWLGHHRLFNLLGRYTSGLLRLNLVVLMLVGLTGYATALLVEYGNHAPAVVTYAGLVAAIGLCQTGMWWYARANRLLADGVDRRLFRYVVRRNLVTPVVFGVSIPLAFLDPDLAKYSWVMVAVLDVALMVGARSSGKRSQDRPNLEA